MGRANFHLTCSICWQLFSYPVELDCGHKFCDSCIDKWKGIVGELKCPACQQVSLLKMPDPFIAQEAEEQDTCSSDDDQKCILIKISYANLVTLLYFKSIGWVLRNFPMIQLKFIHCKMSDFITLKRLEAQGILSFGPWQPSTGHLFVSKPCCIEPEREKIR